MNISCQSTLDAKKSRQVILDLKNAELNRIFIPLYVKFPGKKDGEKALQQLGKYSPETVWERYKPAIEECRKSGIQVAFLKAPVVVPESDAQAVWPMLETSIIQSLELCMAAECSLLLMELPIEIMENNRNARQAAHDFCISMAKKAHEYNVMLLLKNQTKEIGGHQVRGFCAEASDAVEWLDELNHELGYDAFGFCVDTGICKLCGNDTQTYINSLGNRVKVVIIRDNDGQKNISMIPFTSAGSRTEWLGVIRGLRDINFEGELAVDFTDTYGSFSPLLRPALYPLVKKTAEYFKWQIEIENNLKKYKKFVLFGAGNMCRNYMKCYGEKYPPLYTCDNNPKLWDKDFNGIMVKNPEELKNIPKDCCVVICNIYYREIETQLREMGIENIGYFNDEYMPSFYFDRLDNE